MKYTEKCTEMTLLKKELAQLQSQFKQVHAHNCSQWLCSNVAKSDAHQLSPQANFAAKLREQRSSSPTGLNVIEKKPDATNPTEIACSSEPLSVFAPSNRCASEQSTDTEELPFLRSTSVQSTDTEELLAIAQTMSVKSTDTAELLSFGATMSMKQFNMACT